MATVYSEGTEELYDQLDKVIRASFADLVEAEVNIHCLFADNTNEDRPALKLHGYPAVAIIKINSYENRVQGERDATLKIDRIQYKGMSGQERIALLAHEATHILVKRDKKSNEIKRDDCGRPKLGMRPHDFQIGGFEEIVEKYGLASVEAVSVQKSYQRLLPFMEERKPRLSNAM